MIIIEIMVKIVLWALVEDRFAFLAELCYTPQRRERNARAGVAQLVERHLAKV